MNDITPFNPLYVEYGKITRISSMGDFNALPIQRSVNGVNSFYDIYEKIYNREIKSGDELITNTQGELGAVSVSLISYNNSWIYIQIQQRYEGEFLDVRTNRGGRYFNQARFSVLNEATISNYFKRHRGLYTCLLYENPAYPGKYRLGDHINVDINRCIDWEIIPEEISSLDIDEDLLAGIVNSLYNNYQSHKKNESTIPALMVVKPGLSLKQKLSLLDIVQYLLYPILGPITFSFNFIDTGTHILFYFLDEALARIPDGIQVLQEKDLKIAASNDYFQMTQSLENNSDWLYDPLIKNLLDKDIKPIDALALFRLIKTGDSFDSQEELRLLQQYYSHLGNNYLQQLLNSRFKPIDKRFLLLIHANTSGGLRKEILEKFRTELSDNSLEELENKTQLERTQLFLELLRIDYQFREGKNKETTSSLVSINKSILQILMEKVDQEKADQSVNDSLSKLFETTWKSFLISDIMNGFEKGWIKKIDNILMVWGWIPDKTPDLFIQLSGLLTADSAHKNYFSKYPDQYKGYILNGYDILSKWIKSNGSIQRSESTNISFKSLISILDQIKANPQIANLFRETSIEVSKPISNENIAFASWWLMSELVCSKKEILIEDYKKLLSIYQNGIPSDISTVSAKSLFLLSGGKVGALYSLRDACKLDQQEYLNAEVNETLFQVVLDVWIEQKVTIPTADIAYLIAALPDTNGTLARIVKDASEQQTNEVIQLQADKALLWLQRTIEEDKRKLYRSADSHDLLFELLIGLVHPDIQFIRTILIDDPGVYPLDVQWTDYVNNIRKIYSENWSRSFSDSVLDDYFSLANNLNDPLNNKKNNCYVLKRMAEIIAEIRNVVRSENDKLDERTLMDFLFYEKDGSIFIKESIALLLTDCNLNRRTIRVLLFYERDESNYIKEKATLLIKLFLLNNDLTQITQLLDDKTLHKLNNSPTKMNLRRPDINTIFSNELRRRGVAY